METDVAYLVEGDNGGSWEEHSRWPVTVCDTKNEAERQIGILNMFSGDYTTRYRHASERWQDAHSAGRTEATVDKWYRQIGQIESEARSVFDEQWESGTTYTFRPLPLKREYRDQEDATATRAPRG